MLTGKQRRFLRALGHHLAPVVQVGARGVDARVASAAARALFDHELIKVKLPEDVEPAAVAAELAAAAQAEVAQVLGRTALLYKRRPRDPKIRLPGATGPKAGEVHRPAERMHTKGPSTKPPGKKKRRRPPPKREDRRRRGK